MEIHPYVFITAILFAWIAGLTLGWHWGVWKRTTIVEDIARMVGGKVDWMGRLPDGSGAATMSMPLPRDHWLLRKHDNVPPMPWRMGLHNPDRGIAEKRFEEVARYAIRASTMNGAEIDFDPDAMVRNFVVGAIGYYTHDGRTHADEIFETKLQPTVDVRDVRDEVQVPIPGWPAHTEGSSGPAGDGPSQFGGGVPTRRENHGPQGSPTPEEGSGEGQRAGPIRRT